MKKRKLGEEDNMLNRIITLEDGREYCLISEIFFEGVKYYCALEYFENIQDVGKQYFVFKQIFDGDNLSLELVDDKELVEYFLLKFAVENDIKMDNN